MNATRYLHLFSLVVYSWPMAVEATQTQETESLDEQIQQDIAAIIKIVETKGVVLPRMGKEKVAKVISANTFSADIPVSPINQIKLSVRQAVREIQEPEETEEEDAVATQRRKSKKPSAVSVSSAPIALFSFYADQDHSVEFTAYNGKSDPQIELERSYTKTPLYELTTPQKMKILSVLQQAKTELADYQPRVRTITHPPVVRLRRSTTFNQRVH